LRHWVFGAGAAQVLLSASLLGAVAVLLDQPPEVAILLGLLFSLSSTAVVIQWMTDHHLLSQPHGMASFSILMFQDLAVVPILIMTGLLAHSAIPNWLGLMSMVLFKSVAAILLIYLVGRRLFRPCFKALAREHQPSTFVALVLLSTLGVAGLTEWAGLSMALGAFLAGLGPVAVAAGEPEIVAAAEAAGAMAVLTDPDLPSGSDRIHAALADLDPEGNFDPIINLQGDMPTLNPALIRQALAALEDAPDAALSTLVSPSTDAAERADPNVVKAVVSWPDDGAGGATTGRCLYFTRADAPTGAGPIQRHVGHYVWRRSALARFVAAAPSPLELREKLEQLRALELGMTIVARAVDEFPKGVDTPEHLESARAWYLEQAK
jgi:3-deoxy-manno-octulosonate cytidylyltransferase (CMP-KDO synthetase)